MIDLTTPLVRLKVNAMALPVTFVSCEVKFEPPFSREALELIGKERPSRFRDSSRSVLVPGFRECRADQFFGNILRDQPVESSRVPVAAYLQHLDNEAADADLFRSSQTAVCGLAFRLRFFKTVNV